MRAYNTDREGGEVRGTEKERKGERERERKGKREERRGEEGVRASEREQESKRERDKLGRKIEQKSEREQVEEREREVAKVIQLMRGVENPIWNTIDFIQNLTLFVCVCVWL